MNTVEEIENAIRELKGQDLFKLALWFEAYSEKEWASRWKTNGNKEKKESRLLNMNALVTPKPVFHSYE